MLPPCWHGITTKYIFPRRHCRHGHCDTKSHRPASAIGSIVHRLDRAQLPRISAQQVGSPVSGRRGFVLVFGPVAEATRQCDPGTTPVRSMFAPGTCHGMRRSVGPTDRLRRDTGDRLRCDTGTCATVGLCRPDRLVTRRDPRCHNHERQRGRVAAAAHPHGRVRQDRGTARLPGCHWHALADAAAALLARRHAARAQQRHRRGHGPDPALALAHRRRTLTRMRARHVAGPGCGARAATRQKHAPAPSHNPSSFSSAGSCGRTMQTASARAA